ncbi:MAG: glycosyltransferase family A protein, partial [Candidatus Thermoplasmatota archaeon]|nr:glycosyltransferase family A protein [Candidatus Thermoplasmatota archaeon]
MTTYKRDPLLDVAISSILNQTYPDIELIVVDDASPDDNFERLKEKAEADLRIRPFRMQQNGGTYLAKNYGLQQAKGKFISFMDSDDFAHPQKLERQVAQFVKNKQLQGVIHQCIRIDEDSNIEFRGVGSFRMSCISLMIRASVIEKMGYFDSLRVGADTEFI